MTKRKPAPGSGCSPGVLKRLALERLRQRLEEDQMTTAELLKVAALPDEDKPDTQPRGEWTIALAEPPG